jgi:DNA repair protein RadC
MKQFGNLTIKQWASEDRPREKLLTKGISALSDAELLAILLSSGTKNMTAVELAKYTLSTVNNNLNTLGKLNVDELTKINGIGQAKAITIIAALELGKRRKIFDINQNKITSSKDVFNLFYHTIGDIRHEEFWTLYLSRSNKIIDKQKISMGGISGTVVDVKIILKHAIEKLVSSIIIVHNHPSGNINPSDEDKKITEKLKQAAELINITILDHIIIGNNKYYSFKNNGIL